VNPINVKGYKNRDLSLIPDDEILRSNLIKKWQSIDYGNAHSEWHAANTINEHNNIELNKVKMNVITEGVNFQVIRGTGVFVSIYKDPDSSKIQQSSRKETSALVDDAKDTPVIDDTLSGKYYVSGTKYIYDSNFETYKYKTLFQLRKMNWKAEKNVL
jgi:CRISPR/Cas system CSM-associated protein Csm3 (group 7 of RAMP superfamily)